MNRILPRTSVPALEIDTLDGEHWTLSDQSPENFTFVFFYRGLHCPLCAGQLQDVERNMDAFTELGIEPIAISCDSLERARTSQKTWGLKRLKIGYGLTEEQARTWDLYVSEGFKEGEPERFSEPALYVIRPDGTLYATAIQSMPFTRPGAKELAQAFRYIISNDYPARGEK